MNTAALPESLLRMIRDRYPSDADRILSGFGSPRSTTFRVNRLKCGPSELETELTSAGIPFEQVPWFADAFLTAPGSEPALRQLSAYTEGRLYLQNLSAMIPPVLLDPQPGEDILDMCAAPGGKTSQLASLSGGKANLTAVEKDRIRAEKLRYNLDRQGASRTAVLQQDARKLDDFLRFDKVLLDAPCSGSGTVLSSDERTYRAFSEALVRNSAKLQKELLRKAVRITKKGGLIVYATCSVLPEENEETVLPFLKRGEVTVVPHPELEEHLPLLPCAVSGAIAVCPDTQYEGFFAVCLRKT